MSLYLWSGLLERGEGYEFICGAHLMFCFAALVVASGFEVDVVKEENIHPQGWVRHLSTDVMTFLFALDSTTPALLFLFNCHIFSLIVLKK